MSHDVAGSPGLAGPSKDREPIGLSVVIPLFNEAESIERLHRDLTATLRGLAIRYEILYVDDGSTDATAEHLRQFAAQDRLVRVIRLARNSGQTAAMMAGIDHARGEILVAMDGDGQNDPDDIPRLLAELDKGHDVVSGWRRERKDALWSRRIPSAAANWIISALSGVHLHDYGCSLKAYRRSVLDGVRLYGEMHRFIPIYAAWQGGRISELEVRHHARRHGRSKYGMDRVFKVALDMLVVRFLERYLTKPIYLFGGFGILCFVVAMLAGGWALYLKLIKGVAFILTPLPLLVVLCLMMGSLSLLVGLLAEVMVRTYYEAQDKRPYAVRALINFE